MYCTVYCNALYTVLYIALHTLASYSNEDSRFALQSGDDGFSLVDLGLLEMII